MDKIKLRALWDKLIGSQIEYHPKFLDELFELISDTGLERKIITSFAKRLSMLQQLDNIDYGLSWIEHLKEYGNLYSLHIKVDPTNYRFLFCKAGKGKYFLCAFYERSGKGKTEYRPYAEKAIERRDEERREFR